MAEEESGGKWFLRYVVVPIAVAAVGGGGLVAIFSHDQGQADIGRASVTTETKPTPPVSEYKYKKSSTGSKETSPANDAQPANADESSSTAQTADEPFNGSCYAVNVDSNQRLSMLTNLPKYTDVKIFWNVTNLAPGYALYGRFAGEAGLAKTPGRPLEMRSSTEYINTVGSRAFQLYVSDGTQREYFVCTYLMNFILDN